MAANPSRDDQVIERFVSKSFAGSPESYGAPSASSPEELDAPGEPAPFPENLPIDAYVDEAGRLSGPLSAERAYSPYREPADAAGGPSEAWSDPRDITHKGYAGIPLNLDWVPEPFAALIGDERHRTGFDAGGLLLGKLGAAAGVADDALKLSPLMNDLDYLERPCIWGLAVGGPSSGKTPMLMLGIKPLEIIDQALVARNLSKVEDYKYAMERYADQRKASLKDAASVRPIPPEAPSQEEIYCNSMNIEGLRTMLRNSPRGVLWFRDEFGGLIGELDKYSGAKGERYDVLELWNGGLKKTGRVSGSIVVPNWSASLCGGATPSGLRDYAGKLQDDGLLQRFLIAMVEDQKAEHDIRPDTAAVQGYVRILENLRDQQALGPCMKMSQDAYDVRREFMRNLDALRNDEALSSPMRSHLGKFPSMFARLLLLYELIGLAQYGQFPNPSHCASGANAEKVSKLLLLWAYSHIEEFWMDLMSSGRGGVFSQRIARYILSKNVTTLLHSKHVVQPHFVEWENMPFNEQRDSLQRLENAGWIQPDGAKRNKQGFQSAWLVNPAVHEKFTVQAIEATAERAQRRSQMKALREPRELGD